MLLTFGIFMICKFTVLAALLFPLCVTAGDFGDFAQGAARSLSDSLDGQIRQAKQMELMQKQHDLEMERLRRQEEMQIRAEQRRVAESYNYAPPPPVQQRQADGRYCFQLSDGQHCY